jgi:nucleoside-diphosphate-sugar epimerase
MLVDALEGRPTRLPWGADFYRQYLFVEDAVESLLLALRAPAIKRRSYVVSGGTYNTIGEVAEIVRSVIPTADIEVQSGSDPIDDVQGKLDISAAERDFGYHPKYTLAEGIRIYLGWLKVELGYQGIASAAPIIN